jgi:hypothetical protein
MHINRDYIKNTWYVFSFKSRDTSIILLRSKEKIIEIRNALVTILMLFIGLSVIFLANVAENYELYLAL